MVSVPASNVVDGGFDLRSIQTNCGFDPRSIQTKDNKIVFATSQLRMYH
jgi:hypothetical protein